MSRIGIEASLKTAQEIYEAAQAARVALLVGPTGRLCFEMEWLFEKLVRPILGVELDVREDQDPAVAGAHAAFNLEDRTIRVRESVMRRTRLEEPDAIFTMLHELGHAYLHSDRQFFRKSMPRSRLCDPEWQADLFAMEFGVDRALLTKYDTPRMAARFFRLPVPQMEAYFSELRKQHVLVDRPKLAAGQDFEGDQGDFDF